MAPGKFSDGGYRFRENYFSKEDSWIPGVPSTIQKFFDIILFNSDSITVGDDYMQICEFWFRIHIDKIEHSRKVFGLMDWLGALGGVGDVLKYFFVIIYGGYAAFNASIVNINIL